MMKFLTSLWSKIVNLINKGENPTFIAFNAHAGVAAAIILALEMLNIVVLQKPVLLFTGIIFVVAMVLTALKEFWYDIKYENAPVQKELDSRQDYDGWLTGIVLSCAYSLLLLLVII